MNREIKFRAWNSAKKEWFKPIYEAYKGNLHDISITLSGQVQERTLECCADIRNTNDFVLSQYTGLKDKNGVDIYDGDLLQPSEPLPLSGKPSKRSKLSDYTKFYKVVFSEGSFKIQISNSKTKRPLNSILIRENGLIVKGNIYEHQTLIK